MEKSKEEREKELIGKPNNSINKDNVNANSISQSTIKKSYTLKDKLLLTLIIIAVISLGLLAVNQFVQWRYNYFFLQNPCGLCEEINDGVTCNRNPSLSNSMNINISSQESPLKFVP